MSVRPHLSRREIFNAIPLVAAGTALLPLGVLCGQEADSGARGIIRGILKDGGTGLPTAAKVRVSHYRSDEPFLPEQPIRTMPQRSRERIRHYFYAKDSFEVAVPPGRYRIETVRGISHESVVAFAELTAGMTRTVELKIPVLRNMHAAGWYSGNTHTHYQLDLYENPDERLRIVPPAEALDVSVISYLIANDVPYPSNRYPIGRLPQFSRDGTLVDMGEECRNRSASGDFYGHCLFLNIPRLVEPVSTGALYRNGEAPDFPTLSMVCAEARKLGGTTIWCHNGTGLEMPVAAVLGHVDAYNFADGEEADYERYYRLLNCGIRMPASSGTDWWEYDHNRVFVQVAGSFSYESWLAGLRAGKTFVSNGPLLELTVNGKGPGETIQGSGPLLIKAHAVSRLPFDRLEIVQDGIVVAEQVARRPGAVKIEHEIEVERGGWIAARVMSTGKTHAGFTIFGHTSPLYYRVAGAPFRSAEAIGGFIDNIERARAHIRKMFRFTSDAEKALAMGRFESGRDAFLKLMAAAPS